MGLVVPSAREVEVLQTFLNVGITMKLYSNNYTPIGTSVAANFIEVVGGGYGSKTITYANWIIAAGDPSVALYNTMEQWTFTGPTNAPGTIYGVYFIRTSDGMLLWAEPFPTAVVPFVPIAGSIVKYLPKFSAQSLF
jgi:hypothetical protein